MEIRYKMKKKIYITTILLLLLDVISKQIIIKCLNVYDSIKIIPNFFYLTYVQNSGAAFSILQDKRILLLIVAVLALYLLNRYINKNNLSKLECFCYPLIISGILGNFIDRLIYKYVIDFLDFRIFGYNYPIFNLADTFIVIGVILFIIDNFIKERSTKYANKSRK